MKLKPILAIFLFFGTLILPLCKICAQQTALKATYNVSKLKLQKVIVQRQNMAGNNAITDTLLIKNGEFAYNSLYKEPGFFDFQFYFANGKYKQLGLWLAEGEYNIVFDDKLETKITASNVNQFNEQLKALQAEVTNAEAKLANILKNVSYQGKEVSQVETEIERLRDSVGLEMDEKIYKRYITTYPNSPIALYALLKYAEPPVQNTRIKTSPNEIEGLLNQLPKDIVAMPSAQLLLEKLKTIKQMAIGNNFVDIKLPNNKGVVENIYKFRGKYVLVDFWASWCSPCREETPYLKSVFKKYAKEGFHIVAISIDNNLQPWKSAIAEDGTGMFTQLIDKKGLSYEKYAVKYIPENYLLNPEGKIIAKNLRGENLEKLLKEIFKN